jgi:hypothetical protein
MEQLNKPNQKEQEDKKRDGDVEEDLIEEHDLKKSS